jgi:hypothetical protein
MSDTHHHLLDTTDAMVWAEEFCKQFDNWMVRTEDTSYPFRLDPGTMVAWFANAIETGRAHPDHTTLKRCLIGDRFELYLNNAPFHYGIDFLAQSIPLWIDAMVESCLETEARRIEAMRVMESDMSWMRRNDFGSGFVEPVTLLEDDRAEEDE